MKGELGAAQESVKGAAAKTEEILTWQHSAIFQTVKSKPSAPGEQQVGALPCLLLDVLTAWLAEANSLALTLSISCKDAAGEQHMLPCIFKEPLPCLM